MAWIVQSNRQTGYRLAYDRAAPAPPSWRATGARRYHAVRGVQSAPPLSPSVHQRGDETVIVFVSRNSRTISIETASVLPFRTLVAASDQVVVDAIGGGAQRARRVVGREGPRRKIVNERVARQRIGFVAGIRSPESVPVSDGKVAECAVKDRVGRTGVSDQGC